MRGERSRPQVAHALFEFVQAIPEAREGIGVASILAHNDPLTVMELAIDVGADLLALLLRAADPPVYKSMFDSAHLAEEILWQMDTEEWADALSGHDNEGWAATFGSLWTLLHRRLASPDAVLDHDDASRTFDQQLGAGALALLAYMSEWLSGTGMFSLDIERISLDALARVAEVEGGWSGKRARTSGVQHAAALARSRPKLGTVTAPTSSTRSGVARESHFPIEAIVWATPGEVFNGLARHGKHLWVGTRDGPVVLSSDDGLAIDSHFGRLPHWLGVVGETILADFLGEVVSLDPIDGGVVWSHPGEAVAADGDRVMVRQGGRLVADLTTVTCIDTHSGDVKWELHGRGSRPGLFPIAFGRGLAWLSQRLDDDYVCIGVTDEGEVVVTSPIGGTAGEGHVLGDALVAGYRWAWLSDLVRAPGRSAWRYSPYPVANDGRSYVWFEDRHSKGTRYWFGNVERPVTLVPGSQGVHAASPDGPGSAWTAAAGSFFAVAPRPSMHVLRPGKAAVSRDLGTHVRGGPVSDGERIWLVCQGELDEDWVLCLDAAILADALA